jgi:LysM repeat protein
MTQHGTDISGWQPGDPDFTADDFVIVKVSEGTSYVNPNYHAQIAKARSLGKEIGHYCYQDAGDPVGQARYFLTNADIRAGETTMQDIEGGLLKANNPVAEAVAFCQEVKRHGETPMSYMAASTKDEFDWRPLVAENTALVVAAYNPTGPGTAAPWPFVTMWQDSDKNVSGGDDDIFYGDANTWHRIADPAGNVPAPVKPAPVPVKPAPAPAPAQHVYGYTVKNGDTYSGIAAAHGMTLATLEGLNPGKNYNLIHAGDVVNIHEVAHPAPVVRIYTVKPGDTLSGISTYLRIPMDTLIAENHIPDPNKIYPGQHFTY